MINIINIVKNSIITKVNDILGIVSVSKERIELYNKISRCYNNCEYFGIATFGLCDAGGKPKEVCKKVCPHYIDLSCSTSHKKQRL